MQRHHLLPLQLLRQPALAAMICGVGRAAVNFNDFRTNGLLLPATEVAALRFGLPLHRGPHRSYNAMVFERVGQIEAEWSRLLGRSPEIAHCQAVMRLGLLQRALRKRLLSARGKPMKLNRFDRLGAKIDFGELDAMADALWAETAVLNIAA